MRRLVGYLVILAVLFIGMTFLMNQNLNISSENNTGKLKIITTIFPLAHFAQAVGGDQVDVASVVAPGVEPHDFEPNPKDVAKILDADLFIRTGAGIDAWSEKVDRKESVVVATSAVEPITVGEEIDPHFWLDPLRVEKLVLQIADGLSVIDPQNKDIYKKNAEAYNRKLQELNKEFTDSLKQCKKSELITSHAAFAYLADRYSLSNLAIVEDPEEDPSPRRILEIVDLIKNRNISFIFADPFESENASRVIAQESGAVVLPLQSFEGLTSDQQDNGATYLSIMENNLSSLVKGLECQ